jgi:hypothetical protein
MSKHTPGPWQLVRGAVRDQYDTIEGIVGAEDRRIMRGCHPFRADEEQLANARLIAAAPEMLEALKYAVEFIKMYTDQPIGIEILEAIAKAEGSTK